MADASQILSDICSGDSRAADELLPLVYEELRRLAAAKLLRERSGQTLDATALVHEAYVRLVAPAHSEPCRWHGRGHFFSAAAESMRRILVEKARRKGRIRHGGVHRRIELRNSHGGVSTASGLDDVISVHEALSDLERVDQQAAEVVKMHYFLGLSFVETAELLGVSERTAYRNWSYARAWLYKRLGQPDE